MGIDLAKQLFARHARDLTASELTVMGYMCVTALDKANGKGQTARLYFGGWEPLALALGYDTLNDAAKTKVKRALKGLRDKGLVEPTVEHAKTGTRQSYRLCVATTGGPNQTPVRGSQEDPQEGVGSRPNRGSESDPPRTELGGGQDLPQDISIKALPQLQIADPEQPHAFEGRPGDDCETCGCAKANRTAHPLRLLWGTA